LQVSAVGIRGSEAIGGVGQSRALDVLAQRAAGLLRFMVAASELNDLALKFNKATIILEFIRAGGCVRLFRSVHLGVPSSPGSDATPPP
jgi:hypothetical protein